MIGNRDYKLLKEHKEEKKLKILYCQVSESFINVLTYLFYSPGKVTTIICISQWRKTF
jgi:hypothetical protein